MKLQIPSRRLAKYAAKSYRTAYLRRSNNFVKA
jgi:hypothetical protein